jgi:hypothetical protein
MVYKRFKDSRVKVTRVNYLPFQFIARIPKEAVSKDEEITFDAKCVLMFSNLYNISDEETTACFSSVNDKLIKNLKDVFDNLVQRRKEIEIREDQHKRIFGIRALQETVFVMHEAETKNLAEAKYLIRVRFRDDVIAETKIKLLFRNKFKDHQHLLRDDFLADNVGLLEDASASTIITIGLFENAITEKLVGKNRSRTGKGDELFYIEQDGTTGAKRVCVKCQDTPTVNHPETFESEYDPQAESFDYAIFAKILYKNKTIIICGGCESYGTSRIGEYIYENIDKIINDGEAKRDSTLKTHYTNPEFVSIYKIPSAAKAPITLEGHFTK